MVRTILIVSGKGGVGKTTTAINLASALYLSGKNVLLVDSAITTPDIGLHLGAPVTPVNFHHVLSGKAKPREAVYRHSSGLKVLPGSISLQDLKSVKPERMKKALHDLKQHADFLIVDSAAGFGKETLHAIDSVSEVIIVTNPDLPAVTNALKAIKISEDMGKKVTGIIVNKRKNKRTEMSNNSISNMLETEILGTIPDDDKVRESISHKVILVHAFPNSKAAKAYRKIASQFIGEKVSEKGNFFRNLMRTLKIVKE